MMSDLSNIGFNIDTEDEFATLIEKSFETASQIEVPWGFYIHFIDSSGAELWTQLNLDGEFIGFHPHFHGMSRRVVAITRQIEGEDSELDGMFHAWANPAELTEPESGEYPFVFNVPDMKVLDEMDYPQNVEIQLTAFAYDLEFYPNEDDYYGSQDEELQFAVESFMPIGLFDEDENGEAPEPFAVFSGVVQQSEVRTNEMTGEKFYWMLVDTLGGEVDVVASTDLCESLPNPLSIIQGQFWLSGRILD
jgi:hypothetical protein